MTPTNEIVAERARGRKIECSSPMGITIGLIDSIITTARVVGERIDYDALICGEPGDEHQPIRDALIDLATCDPLRKMIGEMDTRAMHLIHDAAEALKRNAAHKSAERSET